MSAKEKHLEKLHTAETIDEVCLPSNVLKVEATDTRQHKQRLYKERL